MYHLVHGDNPEPELQFTRALLEQKPNNYSAWHNRSALLVPNEQTLEEEFDFVQNEFYTDPKDQSPWIFHRWLFSNEKVSQQLHEKDLKACQDLLEIEPDSKWATLTVVWLHMKQRSGQLLNEKDEQQVFSLLEGLKATDTMHMHYYDALRSDVLLSQEYRKQSSPAHFQLTNQQVTRFNACATYVFFATKTDPCFLFHVKI